LHSVNNRAVTQTGDLFSWCAVMRFANQLCPAPWRVPDSADFRNLHLNLGYAMPAAGVGVLPIANTYMPGSGTVAAPEFGGIWGGARFTGYTGNFTSQHSGYWSSSNDHAPGAFGLLYGASNVWPQSTLGKDGGFALRCVRDCPPPTINTHPNTSALTRTEGDCDGFPALTVSATGTGLIYQWFSNTTASNVGGTAITGATNSSFTPPNTIPGTRFYYVVVTNSDGCARASNVSGTRTVNALSAITDWTTVNCNPEPRGTNQGIGTGLQPIRTELGQVSYGTVGNTNPNVGAITVSGNGITQIWSAHVLAAGCDKTQFNVRGSATEPHDAACRRSHETLRQHTGVVNNQPYGDLFSWCAVVMLADLLCPEGWRVPTCRDFIDLDIALGGTGSSVVNVDRKDRYIANTTNDGQSWFGSAFGGESTVGGVLTAQTDVGLSAYWSQTRISTTEARNLAYSADGSINPRRSAGISRGHAVRCVRNP